jgi:peptide/nickel transport system substrate-binding protein
MNTFCSWEIPTKENQWSGRNAARWSSDEYDALYKAAATEMDPVKRAAMYIRMNDLVVGSGYIIPLVQRPTVHAFARKVQAPLSPWTTAFSLLQDWYREA